MNFENHYPLFGYENIDLSFDKLETIIRNERPDWKAALQSIKGIYLITDRISGGRYVGAAYGDVGVWSRWCDYVATGHGGNAGLLALLDQLPIPVKTEKVEEGLGPPGEGEEEMPRSDFSMVTSGLEIPGVSDCEEFWDRTRNHRALEERNWQSRGRASDHCRWEHHHPYKSLREDARGCF